MKSNLFSLSALRLFTFFAFAVSLTFAQVFASNGNTLLIFQIGAATDGNIQRSFVELYNNSDNAVNLNGYSLQYAGGSRGTPPIPGDEPWKKIDLTGTILPRHSFLILGEAQVTAAADAPPAMAFENGYGDMNLTDFHLSNRSVKVVLMSNTTLLDAVNPFNIDGLGTKASGYVDMIGVMNSPTGNNADLILAYETAPGPNYSKQVGVRRKSLTDTDNNSADFEIIRFSDFVTKNGGNIISFHDKFELYRPKNLAYGAWNPVTGIKVGEEYESDPIIAGNPDELAGKLLVLQAYGSSSTANGASHSFVELYNNTFTAINLNGITLFYADGTDAGSGNVNTNTKDGKWETIALTGKIIPAKTSFLILGRKQNLNPAGTGNSGNNPRYVFPDNSGDINDNDFTLSNRAFKVALIRNQNADLINQNPFDMNGAGAKAAGYIDMVGAANEYQGRDLILGFETVPARNSASVAARRINLTDTDNNSTDFGSIDYREYNGTRGTTGEQLEICRPKNLGYGAWDPMGTDNVDGNAQKITSFKFSHQNISWGSAGYWEGVINQQTKTITFTTQRWIANIDKLFAFFELDDYGVVKVNGVPQKSGFTPNDFRKDVVYTVGDTDYTVRFISPQASGIPVIKIDTENGAAITSKEDYTNVTSFVLTDLDNPGNNILSVNPRDQIRGRGNDSWFNPHALKKSYRVRFRDATSLFGLPAARNWVLHAGYRDQTLLYNATAFELGDRLNIPFNHSFNFVELYLNDEYKGNYMVTEHNQIGAGRVDIDEIEGWMVEIDSNYDSDPKFRTTSYNLPVMINNNNATTGDPNDSNNPFYDFVKKDINGLCSALASANFPENGYRDLIDMSTFINFIMIQEIVDNLDFNIPNSVYMYKDKDGLISMGPLWDFDCGYGYAYGTYVHFRTPNRRQPLHPFFRRFFDDPVFQVKYKERWKEKYGDIVSVPDFMDEMADKLKKSAEENFKTWWFKTWAPWTNTRPSEPNNFLNSISLLKSWYNAQVSYLNSEINRKDPCDDDDGTPLKIVSYDPQDSQEESLRPIVRIEFNKPLDESILAGKFSVTDRSGNPVSGVPSCCKTSNCKGVMHYIFNADLKPQETYTVKLDAGIKDAFGNAMSEGFSFDFIPRPREKTLVVVLDDFNNALREEWWQPEASGSTTGINTGTTKVVANSQVRPAVESAGSARMNYQWLSTTANPHLRWHNMAVTPKFLTQGNSVQYYLFGDGSNSSVAVVLRVDGTGDMWRHQLITLDWVGWKLITWDMSNDPVENYLVGNNSALPAGNVNLSCFAVYPAPAEERSFDLSSIFFSGLRVVKFGNYLSPVGIEKPSTEKAAVSAYYDLLGRKLAKEPTNGIYIILYDNGKAAKAMK